MADCENPTSHQANPAGGIGAEAVGWVKALAAPLAGGGAYEPHARTPPPEPPGSSGGRWRWEPDTEHAAEQHEAPNGDGIHAAAPSDGSSARVSSGGFLDFFVGAGPTAPVAPAAPERGHGTRSGAAAAAVQSSARLSTRPGGFEGRDAHKRFAMPCITLREDTRGNVTLFGMEPGGALEALGTVRSGDIIVQVDGKPALGRTEKQVRGLLVGEKGSVCTIHWVPPDSVLSLAVLMPAHSCRVKLAAAFGCRHAPPVPASAFAPSHSCGLASTLSSDAASSTRDVHVLIYVRECAIQSLSLSLSLSLSRARSLSLPRSRERPSLASALSRARALSLSRALSLCLAVFMTSYVCVDIQTQICVIPCVSARA
jgi:hypothetical protein